MAVYAASGSELPGVPVVDVGVDSATLERKLYRASGGAADSAAAESALRPSIRRCERTGTTSSTTTPSTRRRSASPPGWRPPSSTRSTYRPARRPPPRSAVPCRGSPPTVATVSAFQATAWRAVVPVDAILPPCVPTARIPWSRAEATGALFAGRLSPEKGAAEAIDIAQAAGVPIDLYGDSYDADYARDRIDPRA